MPTLMGSVAQFAQDDGLRHADAELGLGLFELLGLVLRDAAGPGQLDAAFVRRGLEDAGDVQPSQ